MAKRGRRSAASQQVVSLVESTRLIPPNKLGRREKAFWRQVVNSLPAEYFRSSDIPLLENYCRMSVRAKDLANMIPAGTLDIEVEKMYQRYVSSLNSLATKLRLCPNARTAHNSAKLQDPKTKARPWDSQRNS